MEPERNLIRDAEEAARIYNHYLVKEFFEAYRSRIVEAWVSTQLKDTEERERLYNLSVALNAFEEHFKTYIESGRLSALRKKRKFSII